MRIWCFPTTSNAKTGPVPTVAIHPEDARESCTGCPLSPKAVGGNGNCYAWSGRVAQGLFRSAVAKRKSYGEGLAGVGSALAFRSVAAKMIRITSLGDIGRAPEYAAPLAELAKEFALDLVGYTHHWREPVAAPWKGNLMASVEGELEELLKPAACGWRGALVHRLRLEPFLETHGRAGRLPNGQSWLLCPAQLKPGEITCNDCRLCAGSKAGPHVVFAFHGAAANRELGKGGKP